MKFKITVKNEEKDFDVKIPGGKLKGIWKHLSKVSSSEGQDMNAVQEFEEYLDGLACEILGLSVEEWDSVDIEEQSKITGYVTQKAKDKLGFTMPS